MKRYALPTLLFVCALVCVAMTPAAEAAECPNEAFRVGPSASLPECRAYEMVTPPDKEGGAGVYIKGEVKAASSGDGVAFVSPSAYGDAQGNTLNNRYIATRANGAWATTDIDGPQAMQEMIFNRATFAVSENLEWAFTVSKEAFVPGAIPYGSNMYLRNSRTGQTILIAAIPGNKGFEEWTTINGAPFVGASTDWSHVLVHSELVLAPGGEAGKSNLYEFSNGELKLVAPPGAEPAARAEQPFMPHVMSADGHRFFYTEGGVLYMHEDGAAPIAISASENSGEEGVLKNGEFLGASANGDAVFFWSNGNLTGESEGSTPGYGRQALYRYEPDGPAGRRLTDLTPNSIISSPEGLAGQPLGLSNDGTFFYFTSAVGLIPGEEEEEHTQRFIYVWHGAAGEAGALRYVGRTEEGITSEALTPIQYRVSENGRHFAMASAIETPGVVESPNCAPQVAINLPAGHCLNVFAWSYDEPGNLSCVTCVAAPLESSELGGQNLYEVFTYVGRSVLDNGTVFFNTPNPLVPRDTNGLTDVYGWRQGAAQLLSPGTGDIPSTFGDASPDGSNVFIKTSRQLVGQDTDLSLDLYDVRVDGGLAGQAGAEPEVSCVSEDGCRGGAMPARAAGAPATTAVNGPGNVRPARCVAGRAKSLRAKAKKAQRRARSLGHRAGKATGKRAKALRRQARHQRALNKQFKKQARNCAGGGR